MIIIGITGTLGSGKGTIVDYLVKTKGFIHFSVRNFLIKIISERNLPVNRDSMTIIANELRSTHYPAYIAEQLYEKAAEAGKNCIIESLRTPAEVELLKNKGNFTLFAVDADPKIRYKRILLRKSETDNVSFETFIANEKREMASTDPDHQNINKCIKMADFNFNNDGSLEELFRKTDEVLKTIIKS